MKRAVKRPLWMCPKCGHRFVTKNLSHSCVRIALRVHFDGKPRERKLTYEAYRVGTQEITAHSTVA